MEIGLGGGCLVFGWKEDMGWRLVEVLSEVLSGGLKMDE